MTVAIKLPNGNKYVRRGLLFSEWIEVYDHEGVYEGIVFPTYDLCLPTAKSKYTLVRLSPTEFNALRRRCETDFPDQAEYLLNVEPYDKDPFA